MITQEEFKKFAPGARQDYIDAFCSAQGFEWLSAYNITDTADRFCGFMGNVGHETGGFRIVRESLNYRTPSRLREVWPSRFGHRSDRELARYLQDERTLADAVYSGRMGNRPGTSDAYDFRGAGPMQTTGREDFIDIGKKIGVDLLADPSLINNMTIMLAAACVEWGERGCNDACDNGDFEGASCIINAGVGTYLKIKRRGGSFSEAVVGLSDRKLWRRRALGVWGDDPDLGDPPAAERDDGVPTDSVPGQETHWTDPVEAV